MTQSRSNGNQAKPATAPQIPSEPSLPSPFDAKAGSPPAPELPPHAAPQPAPLRQAPSEREPGAESEVEPEVGAQPLPDPRREASGGSGPGTPARPLPLAQPLVQPLTQPGRQPDTEPPRFSRQFEPRHGEAVTVAPGVQRVTAQNTGPLTFLGTNSYIVGDKEVLVVDPGPADAAHLAALRQALLGRHVKAILLTHCHRDHCGLALALKGETGAPIAANGRHRSARALFAGEVNPLAESSDAGLEPDIALGDGAEIAVAGYRLQAVATPGHTANHLALSLLGTGILFSGDHVMAWATSIIAPPDGNLGQYMASLDRLIARDDRLLLPGHGGPVEAPERFLRALKTHRLMREKAILSRLTAGDRRIGAIVAALYADVDPHLHGAAALSVLAHLEDLCARGLVESGGPPLAGAEFRLVGG